MSDYLSLYHLIRRCAALPLVLLVLPLWVYAQSGLSLTESSFRSLAQSGTQFLALSDDGGLHLSTDGGASFTQQASAPAVVGDANADFYGLGALGSSAVAVGVDGLIVRSTDSGQSWTQAVAPVLFGSLDAVAARADGGNPNHWLAVGSDGFDGALYRSTDDGANWTAMPAPTDVSFRAVIWTGQRWLAAGSDSFGFSGKIYHSIDGSTWTAASLPGTALPLLDLASDSSGTVLAVGEGGEVLRSDDDGLSFISVLPDFAGGVDLNAVSVNSSGDFVVGGAESLLFSYDGSTASIQVPATAGAAPVRAIATIAGTTLVAGPATVTGPRSEPLTLEIGPTPGASDSLTLNLHGTYAEKVYYLQTRDELDSGEWTDLADSQTLGNGNTLSFQIQLQNTQLFFRAVEF